MHIFTKYIFFIFNKVHKNKSHNLNILIIFFRCCKMHDWCYDATECPVFSGYFIPYYWRCYRGHKPVCG